VFGARRRLNQHPWAGKPSNGLRFAEPPSDVGTGGGQTAPPLCAVVDVDDVAVLELAEPVVVADPLDPPGPEPADGGDDSCCVGTASGSGVMPYLIVAWPFVVPRFA
jgi:hypothetical protein